MGELCSRYLLHQFIAESTLLVWFNAPMIGDEFLLRITSGFNTIPTVEGRYNLSYLVDESTEPWFGIVANGILRRRDIPWSSIGHPEERFVFLLPSINTPGAQISQHRVEAEAYP